MSQAEVRAAYAKLEKASQVFSDAILEFQKTYEPNTVGLDYLISGLEDTMYEIKEDINFEFGEESYVFESNE